MMDTEKKTFVLVHGAWHGGWWLSSHRGSAAQDGARGFHTNSYRRRRTRSSGG
jgi:hypothetical protein